MATGRMRHVQQEMQFARLRNEAWSAGAAVSEAARRDGRCGGRPPKGPRASEPHKRRAGVKPSEPVHVTLRAVEGLPGCARARYKAVREAIVTVLGREDCRIVHLSIQRNHVHLLVEADDRMALARGMQAFQISAAKHINAAVSSAGSWWERRRMRVKPKRAGQVFADRYHAELHPTPQAGAARARVRAEQLAQAPRGSRRRRAGLADRSVLEGWASRAGRSSRTRRRVEAARELSADPVLAAAELAAHRGWRMYGLVSIYEVPGPRASIFPG